MQLQNYEDIHSIILHCSATYEGVDVSAKDIDKWHKARGWSMIGYHRVIRLDGTVENGRPFFRRGAHVAGNNTNTLGFCMIGGLDSEGKPKNTFSQEQYNTLMLEIINARKICQNITTIDGHRDHSPDLNGDGIITRDEWIKECPCFDVAKWLKDIRYEQ
jgi:hypothetical protein